MDKLQEIPKYVTNFSMPAVLACSVLVLLLVFIVLTTASIADSNKRYSDRSLNEKSIGTNIIYSFILGLLAFMLSFVVLSSIAAETGNYKEIEDVAFKNITEVYSGNFEIDDFHFSYEYKINSDKRDLEEVTTQYDDLDTGTRYDLVFVFKDNKEPILLKTGNVTDELITSLKK